MSRGVATCHVLLHVAEICLQMEAAVLYFYTSPSWFVIISALVIAPLVVTNAVSFVWIYKSMDFTNRPCARCVCAILHLLQLGTVWRYFKYVLVYDIGDYEEMIFLRMVHAVLQSTPYFVVQSYLLLTTKDVEVVSLVSLIIALCSVILVYSTFVEGNAREVQKELRIGEIPVTKISVEPIKYRRQCYATILQVLYRTCLISSRLCVLALSTTALVYWLALPLTVHWISMVVYYKRVKTVKSLNGEEWARLLVVSYAQLIDLLNIAENERPITIAIYYLITVVENSILTVLSLIKLHYLAQPNTKLAILIIVYGGFVVGVVFLLIYHKCLSRRRGTVVNYRPQGYKHHRIRGETSRKDCDARRAADRDQLLAQKTTNGCSDKAHKSGASARELTITDSETVTEEAETSMNRTELAASDEIVILVSRPTAPPKRVECSRRSSSFSDDVTSSDSEDESRIEDEGQWTTCSDNDSFADVQPTPGGRCRQRGQSMLKVVVQRGLGDLSTQDATSMEPSNDEPVVEPTQDT